jgi:hypothetical protein
MNAVPPSGLGALELMGAPVAVHPELEQVRAAATHWVRAHRFFGGLTTDAAISRWDFGLFGSAMFPAAPRETAELAANFTNWIAVVDDLVEKDPVHIASLSRSTSAGDKDGDTVNPADVLREQGQHLLRSIAGADRPAMKRLTDETRENLFAAYAWEAEHRRARTVPTLEEYARWRPLSGGALFYLLMARSATRAHLHKARFTAEEEQTARLMCFANDLLSAPWDAKNQNPINLVAVLAATQGDALAAGWSLFLQEWRELTTSQSTDHLSDEPAHTLRSMVAGVLTWMGKTLRYE